MEFNIILFLILIYNLFGLCSTQRRQLTTSGCIINSCSYARDIRAMDCEGRQLVCVPSNALYKPSDSIKLAQNTISRIQQNSFTGYTRLTQLDISNNVIVTLDPNAFRSVSTLQSLFINFNQLTQIEATVLTGLRNLRILQIQGNNIQSIHTDAFRDLVSIRELNLAGNRLRNLPDGVFSAMSAMQTLFLQENQLAVSLDSGFLLGLRGLRDIDLDGNRFTAIPRLNDLTRLMGLDITDSRITVVRNNSFQHTARLRDIALSGNMISSIEPLAFVGLENAVELDISFNAITEIQTEVLAPLRSLEILMLQNNGITVLRNEHFTSLTSLRTLNLEANKLKKLPLMSSLRSLVVLNAKANMLETFDLQTLKSIPRVSKLQLTGNQLQCDCRLGALTQWFIASGPAHHPFEIPRCMAPEPIALRGTRITSLSQGTLVCEPPTIKSGVRVVQRMEGSGVTLSCIHSGFPAPEITWMGPDGFVYSFGIAARVSMTETGELTFRTLALLDEGQYTCFGTNPAGRARASVTLRVTPNPNKRPTTAPAGTPRIPTTFVPRNPVKLTTPSHLLTTNSGKVTDATPRPTVNLISVSAEEGIDIGNEDPSQGKKTPGHKEENSREKDYFPISKIPILSTEPNQTNYDKTDTSPICMIGHSNFGLIGAILCTFFITMVCVILTAIAWQKGLIPTGLKVMDRKERLVSIIRRRESTRQLTPAPLSQSESTRQRRVIHPPNSIRSGIQSYDRMEDSSLGSSYSFSEVSTESVSVSSREETARYVTTESVIDPNNVRMRQQKLAAIANSVAHSSLSDSDISSVSCSPRGPSQRRVYANAAVVGQDPNYTSLWRQADVAPTPSEDNYESADRTPTERNTDSRIYIDVR